MIPYIAKTNIKDTKAFLVFKINLKTEERNTLYWDEAKTIQMINNY